MGPYSRPIFYDYYKTLSQSKWLQNHTLSSGTYPYSQYMGVPPRPALFSLVPYLHPALDSLHISSRFCHSSLFSEPAPLLLSHTSLPLFHFFIQPSFCPILPLVSLGAILLPSLVRLFSPLSLPFYTTTLNLCSPYPLISPHYISPFLHLFLFPTTLLFLLSFPITCRFPLTQKLSPLPPRHPSPYPANYIPLLLHTLTLERIQRRPSFLGWEELINVFLNSDYKIVFCSGRAPFKLTLEQIKRDEMTMTGNALCHLSAHTVTVPGAAAAWVDTVERFGSKRVSNFQLVQLLHVSYVIKI